VPGRRFRSCLLIRKQQTQKFCGLEAKITDPSTGKTNLLYIGGSFDDQYVKVNFSLLIETALGGSRCSQLQTSGYIDIMIDSFSSLHGNPNGDKNKVIKGAQWELTGRVNTQYAAPGASWPVSSAAVSSAKPTTSKATTSSQSPSQPSGTCAGCLGAQCDGRITVCKDGLTCLAPDGVCSNAACNWG
jgi:hypothetical protein